MTIASELLVCSNVAFRSSDALRWPQVMQELALSVKLEMFRMETSSYPFDLSWFWPTQFDHVILTQVSSSDLYEFSL